MSTKKSGPVSTESKFEVGNRVSLIGGNRQGKIIAVGVVVSEVKWDGFPTQFHPNNQLELQARSMTAAERKSMEALTAEVDEKAKASLSKRDGFEHQPTQLGLEV